MVDHNLDIPFGFDYLVKVYSIPLPQFEETWERERFLSFSSNDIGSDKIDLCTVKRILENTSFFMNFKRHIMGEGSEEHFGIVRLCEVAAEFYVKILLKNLTCMRIQIGTSAYEGASLDLMEFLLRNLYKKLTLKHTDVFEDKI